MSKALVSFGVGPLAPLFELTRPAMQRYADRHGYEAVLDTYPPIDPPSWGKLPILLDLLLDFEAVLWVDADCLIVDHEDDVLAGLDSHHALAWVTHLSPEGPVPNAGFMAVTRGATRLLHDAFDLYHELRDHVWWEQAALIRVIERDSWSHLIRDLDPGWNRHPRDRNPTDRVRVEHYTNIEDRLGALRRRLADPDAPFAAITGVDPHAEPNL